MSHARIIGVDVSQASLDICIIDDVTGDIISQSEYPNTPHGHQNIYKDHCAAKQVRVVLEATGNYHLKYCIFLEEHDIDYCIVNPLVIKRYAQMRLERTKTDRRDAYLIASYGFTQEVRISRISDDKQLTLKSLSMSIRQLDKQRRQLRNLRHAQSLMPETCNRESVISINSVLAAVESEIQRLEADQLEIVRSHYGRLCTLITSIPGIGNKVAVGAITHFGDLSGFTHYKQLVSYIGTDPNIRESGSSLKKYNGISKRGNSYLRQLFYLAALSASRHNQACRQFYNRLIANGKRKKTALIAVANKLLKQMFAVIKNDRPFIVMPLNIPETA